MWKKEVARDLIALGGMPFYLLVVVRAMVGGFTPVFLQLLIAFLVLCLLGILFSQVNQHIARALVIATFTSLLYGDVRFTGLVIVMIGIMLYALKRMKIKDSELFLGILAGVVAAGMGYFLA